MQIVGFKNLRKHIAHEVAKSVKGRINHIRTEFENLRDEHNQINIPIQGAINLDHITDDTFVVFKIASSPDINVIVFDNILGLPPEDIMGWPGLESKGIKQLHHLLGQYTNCNCKVIIADDITLQFELCGFGFDHAGICQLFRSGNKMIHGHGCKEYGMLVMNQTDYKSLDFTCAKIRNEYYKSIECVKSFEREMKQITKRTKITMKEIDWFQKTYLDAIYPNRVKSEPILLKLEKVRWEKMILFQTNLHNGQSNIHHNLELILEQKMNDSLRVCILFQLKGTKKGFDVAIAAARFRNIATYVVKSSTIFPPTTIKMKILIKSMTCLEWIVNVAMQLTNVPTLFQIAQTKVMSLGYFVFMADFQNSKQGTKHQKNFCATIYFNDMTYFADYLLFLRNRNLSPKPWAEDTTERRIQFPRDMLLKLRRKHAYSKMESNLKLQDLVSNSDWTKTKALKHAPESDIAPKKYTYICTCVWDAANFLHDSSLDSNMSADDRAVVIRLNAQNVCKNWLLREEFIPFQYILPCGARIITSEVLYAAVPKHISAEEFQSYPQCRLAPPTAENSTVICFCDEPPFDTDAFVPQTQEHNQNKFDERIKSVHPNLNVNNVTHVFPSFIIDLAEKRLIKKRLEGEGAATSLTRAIATIDETIKTIEEQQKLTKNKRSYKKYVLQYKYEKAKQRKKALMRQIESLKNNNNNNNNNNV